LRNVGKWLSLRRALRSIQTETRFDLVFFMFLDDFLVPLVSTKWLDSAFPYPWAGIYMQPLFRLQNAKLGRRREFFRRDHLLRSSRFKGAMVLDEASAGWLTDRFKRPFVPLPEPGDLSSPDIEAPIVKELLAFAAGRPIVGAFGSLAKRKGLLTLLRVAAQNAGAEFVLAIAGKLEVATYTPDELAEIETATAALGDRCWYRPEPIPSDGAFFGLMSVSSVAYLAYEDWVNSSGLQSMAAHFKVPSVVADNGIMAERAHAFQTGLTIDPTSIDAAAAAIQKLLTEKLPDEGFVRYAAQHSTGSFKAELSKFVASAAQN